MSSETIDEQEWLKNVMSEYKEILRQKETQEVSRHED